jgi:hypothetical protein
MSNSAFTPTVLQSFQDASISQPGLVNTTTQSFAGDKTFTGNLNVVGNGRGIVPLGAIIAMTTGITGAMAVPASGSASFGWQRADGAAIAGGSTLSGTTPNLSTSIFLRGATTYGGTGGANAKVIALSELPAHSHTITDPGHFHSIDHDHGVFNSQTPDITSTGGTSNDHTHVAPIQQGSVYTSTPNNPGAYIGAQYTNDATGLTSYSGNPITSGQNTTHSHDMNHIHSIDVPNYTGNSGSQITGLTVNSTAAATAFDVQPNYINVIYLIRVN